MKKTILFLAALAMMAAGCSQKDDLAVTNTDPNAISFSAYTSTAVTRGVVTDGTDIYGEDEPGIGVFAFYQPAVRGEKVLFNSRKYATPDFMYNQSVTSTNGSTWTYSPIKFWPNNTNDMVSFFAYAPYDSKTTWEDLGITTDACANKLTATFPIYTERTAMQDVLWAEPVLNNLKPSTTDGAVNNPITFNFKHILSKVALYVGVETDQAKGEAGTWTDANTKITIDKVEFTNLAAAVVYTDSIDDDGNLIEMTTAKCVGSSAKQNIVLTNENNDFEDTTAVISKTNGTWATIAMFRDLLAKESSKDAFLFLAPQKFEDEQVAITYTVATTASDASNSSSITNTITKDLSDVLVNAGGEFKSGSAYKLKFLIGMNSVKFDVDVVAWDDANAIVDTINVPANDTLSIQVKAATGANCTFLDIDTTNGLSFTVKSNTKFDKIYYKNSMSTTEWFNDSLEVTYDPNITEAVNSYHVSIAKSALGDSTKTVFVRTIKTPSVSINPSGSSSCTITNASEDATYVYFTINSTTDFNHAYYRLSNGTEPTSGDSTLIIDKSSSFVKAYYAKIAKSNLGTSTHIHLTTTVIPSVTVVAATGSACTITNLSENASNVSFTINNGTVDFNHAYYRLSDGTTEPTSGDSTLILDKSSDFVKAYNATILKSGLGTYTHIYVTATVVPTIAVTAVNCTLTSVAEDADTLTFVITDDGTKTKLTLKGDGSTTLSTTTTHEEGKYAEAKSSSTHTIKYYKQSSGEYESIKVTASSPTMPVGALTGKFTINSNGDQVYFSSGNLQATCTTAGDADNAEYSWDFAANQYDYVGAKKGNTSIDSQVQDSIVDLFGWVGASASLTSDAKKHGINTGSTDSDYGSSSNDALLEDWGMTIDDMGTWRTLTKDEWVYLFNTRNASTVNGVTNARYCRAKVAEVKGVILFPDNYTHPSGVSLPTYINHNNISCDVDYSDVSSYSADQWTQMESVGCVFLPCAGVRVGSSVTFISTAYICYGQYWSSTAGGRYNACYVTFGWSQCEFGGNTNRYKGYSVRLVCAAE